MAQADSDDDELVLLEDNETDDGLQLEDNETDNDSLRLEDNDDGGGELRLEDSDDSLQLEDNDDGAGAVALKPEEDSAARRLRAALTEGLALAKLSDCAPLLEALLAAGETLLACAADQKALHKALREAGVTKLGHCHLLAKA
eukprot:2017369-Prymnesium_polylepis.1